MDMSQEKWPCLFEFYSSILTKYSVAVPNRARVEETLKVADIFSVSM